MTGTKRCQSFCPAATVHALSLSRKSHAFQAAKCLGTGERHGPGGDTKEPSLKRGAGEEGGTHEPRRGRSFP